MDTNTNKMHTNAHIAHLPKTIDWKRGMTTAEQNVKVDEGTEVIFNWEFVHNVYMFASASAYTDCDFSGATKLSDESGYRFSTEHKSGAFYFGCEYSGHCKDNQKLHLEVSCEFYVCYHFRSR